MTINFISDRKIIIKFKGSDIFNIVIIIQIYLIYIFNKIYIYIFNYQLYLILHNIKLLSML